MHYSDIYQIVSNNPLLQPVVSVGRDTPREWSTIYYKTYPRLPRIGLSRYIKLLRYPIGHALIRRASWRAFRSSSLSLELLANILFYSAGLKRYVPKTVGRVRYGATGRTSRFYPSGGALYPLEIYPIVLRETGRLARGIYHYNVYENSLELLWEKDLIRTDRLEQAFLYPWAKKAAVLLCVTAIFHRTQVKYSERGYRIILQDSGHLSQNVYLVSEAMQVGCCALSGYSESIIDKILDVDGVNESTVLMLALGPKSTTKKKA